MIKEGIVWAVVILAGAALLVAAWRKLLPRLRGQGQQGVKKKMKYAAKQPAGKR